MEPGSDVAGMSLFGNDPARVYTGRAPLEAASMGVPLGDADVALRCNLVVDRGARRRGPGRGWSTTAPAHREARRAPDRRGFPRSDIYRERFLPDFELFPGVGYRHLLVWRGGSTDAKLTAAPRHHRQRSDHLPPARRRRRTCSA
jgi:2,3-bisphosphoglycerate-independent phosphoglycerate mutase